MKTLTDEFAKHLGEYEYNAFVRKMITWFYGEPLKYAWCAISMSYMANQMGILDQFGGKNQNCYEMLKAVAAAVKKTKKGKLTMRENLKKGQVIKRGTVMFMLNDTPPMQVKSHKHVTTCYKDFEYKGTGTYQSLGGNQRVTVKVDGEEVERDGIYVKPYSQSRIYAIFEPDYGEKLPDSVKEGSEGSVVSDLQNYLNQLGYPDAEYNPLKIDGKFGLKTKQAVECFQKHNGLTVDGKCGPKTWTKIFEVLNGPKKYATALRTLVVHTAPKSKSPKKTTIKKGVRVEWGYMENKWLYLPRWNGWITSVKGYVTIE